MPPYISIVIPNRNGASTIRRCLEAAFACRYETFEVVVADDCSSDGSRAVIEDFPCRLVRLDRHGGASAARNAGAAAAGGELLFFTDADCLLRDDALAVAAECHARHGPGVIIGGTYTPDPCDADFFSRFQSVFVNHSEARQAGDADYAAGHALVIAAADFRRSDGFTENFLPVAEDVEFSHRMRRAGYRIVIESALQVRHMFGFSLGRSLRNAAFKAQHWTRYSLRNRDILADSGTASIELKANVLLCLTGLALLPAGAFAGYWPLFPAAMLPFAASLFVSRGLVAAFFRTGGPCFGIAAVIYYLTLYPLAVAAGACTGIARYFLPGGAGKAAA
jgi:glycosyltransferase involved in cell wall biosynthesis